jgi:hypothetical protein
MWLGRARARVQCLVPLAYICAVAQASERELAELAPMAKDLMICTYKERP